MIKMTDNQMNNVFAFFCDICGKEIKDRKGECLFDDTEPDKPVVPAFAHYECSKRYEKQTHHLRGNMSIQDFIECLSNE